VSANLFSPRVYSHFNPGWEANIGKPKKISPQEILVEIKRRPPLTNNTPQDDSG
jgi:hypothetical protein